MKKRIMMVFTLVLIIGLIAERLAAETFMVSVSSDGTQGNGNVGQNSISSDGHYVSFVSDASNMVDDDTNEVSDIFVHDRLTGQTIRVSVSSEGLEGNGVSDFAHISPDGRYVVFHSEADNLVEGDINQSRDVFVHDLQTGITDMISMSSAGTQGNAESSWPNKFSLDGRFVAFASSANNLVEGDTNEVSDVFVHDRQMGETTRVSVSSEGTQSNGASGWATVSADGRYVAFLSSASNLVSDDTNEVKDIFVHDRQTGETIRISMSSSGTQGNGDSDQVDVSLDGGFVVFRSYASNLVDNDTNQTSDIFLYDRLGGKTTIISVSTDGVQGNAFSTRPNISSNGRYITFYSDSNNLIAEDTNERGDIFVHDRLTGQTIRVSVSSEGTQGNNHSTTNSTSSSGRYVAFRSEATNLVPDDTNGTLDIFVNDLAPNDFTVNPPISTDNAINDDGNSSVTITWIDSTSEDVDHYEIIARVGAAPEGTETVTGQNNIAPGTQTATFEWNAGDNLYVGVVAVDTMGFQKLCLNENEPNVPVVDDTVNTTTTTTALCPSETIFGEYSKKTELLRFIRDNLLNQTPEGQELIRLYYKWGPFIVGAMEKDEEFKEYVKEMMDGILMLIRRDVG